MSYREVSVIEVRAILRLWLAGRGLREVARLSGADRKTVRRYVDRARAGGLDRDGDACQLTDELSDPQTLRGNQQRALRRVLPTARTGRPRDWAPRVRRRARNPRHQRRRRPRSHLGAVRPLTVTPLPTHLVRFTTLTGRFQFRVVRLKST